MLKRKRIRVYSRYLPVMVKPKTYEALKKIAASRGEDVSKVVRTAIQAEIKRFRKENKNGN